MAGGSSTPGRGRLLESLVVIGLGAPILLGLFFLALSFKLYTIPSASMDPSIPTGSYVLALYHGAGGSLFARPVGRGDVVLYRSSAANHAPVIKRLVGMPGDRVQIRSGQVYINDQAVPQTSHGWSIDNGAFEAPMRIETAEETLAGRRYSVYLLNRQSEVENTGVFTLPNGCYFMIGDNRDNSLDSRFIGGPTGCTSADRQPFLAVDQASGGFVAANDILGSVVYVLRKNSAPAQGAGP